MPFRFDPLFRSQAALRLEHLALRHQLAVYKQTVSRPRRRPTDRLFWAWRSRLWTGWQAILVFVQPRTVIAWQQKRFGRSGVPASPSALRLAPLEGIVPPTGEEWPRS
jgi:hypothetical protein